MSRAQPDESWRNQPVALPTLPDWVHRWLRARALGDERIFPEQIGGYLDLGLELPAAPMSDDARWVQPHQHAT